jgi:hypothetical protein
MGGLCEGTEDEQLLLLLEVGPVADKFIASVCSWFSSSPSSSPGPAM